MKKSKIISIAIAMIMVCSVSLAGLWGLNKLGSKTNADETVPVTPEVFTTLNGYNYMVSEAFEGSPDSFEAWIKLPETSLGGTIMGNRINSSYGYNDANWGVDAFGYFYFEWANASICHTFSSASLFDAEWHHVALVRNDSAFTYYLDGELTEVYNVESSECISTSSMKIGVDKRVWLENKIPFEGAIRQITVYSGAISPEQVASDMNKQFITASDVLTDDVDLMANWYMGPEWNQRRIESSKEGGPRLDLGTHDKYVGADYSFGEYDYSFVIIPDIQIMTHYNPTRFNNVTNWLASQKDAMNIEFALQVGDLADTGRNVQEYINAANGLDNLNNIIPYCFAPGNHDYNDNFASRNSEYLNTYFPYEKHSQLPGFGGVYEENKMENSYHIFETDYADYLVICLEFHPRMSAIRWAGRVLEQYPEHRAIIVTHDLIEPDGTFVENVSAGFDVTSSQQLYDCLISKYPNVFMAVGGHHPNDDILRHHSVGENGNKILSMLVDGQGSKYKGDTVQDMILLCHVNESKKTMNFVYYSPSQGKVWNLQNQFQVYFADELNPTIGK